MSTFVLKKEYSLQLPSSYVDIYRDEMEYVEGGATATITVQRAWLISVGVGMVAGIIAGSVVGSLGGGVVAVQAGRVTAAFISSVVSYMIQNNKSSKFTFNFWIPGNKNFKKYFGY